MRGSCHFLLQGIFSTRRSNAHVLCLLPCRWILCPLSHGGAQLDHHWFPFTNLVFTIMLPKRKKKKVSVSVKRVIFVIPLAVSQVKKKKKRLVGCVVQLLWLGLNVESWALNDKFCVSTRNFPIFSAPSLFCSFFYVGSWSPFVQIN